MQKKLRAALLKVRSGDAEHQITALKASVRKQRTLLRELSTACEDARRRYAEAKKQARSARATAAHAQPQRARRRSMIESEREEALQVLGTAKAENAAVERELRRQLSARDEQLADSNAKCDVLLRTQEKLTAMGRTGELIYLPLHFCESC